jgi:hypothetical protein
MMGRVMMRAVTLWLGRAKVLPDHRPAVFVVHDFPVGHAMTLTDRPLRKILARLVVHLGVRVRRGPMMRLGPSVRRGMVDGRSTMVRWAAAALMRMRGSAVVGIVLPRLCPREVREGRRRFARGSRHWRRKLRGGRRRRRRLVLPRGVGRDLLRRNRRSRDAHGQG